MFELFQRFSLSLIICLLIVCSTVLPIPAHSDERLMLSCKGEYVGAITKSVNTFTSGFSRSSGSGVANTTGDIKANTNIGMNSSTSLDANSVSIYSEEKREDTSILIDVREDGWIQIPSSMLPRLQKVFPKKENKWSFKNFELTDEQISGKFNFGLINRPKFTISRLTGKMDMNIFGATFEGQCAKVDTSKKLF